MTVQESGVTVGWPLNLGHNTTGWPLGLRLRLMHEDLQWPTLPEHLALSSSGVSTNSSSLDTMSTKSFFQDKTTSLGALLGLPLIDIGGNHQHRYQQRQHRAFLSPAAPSNSPAVSRAQTVNRTSKSKPIPHRHRLGRSTLNRDRLQHQISTSSTIRGSPSAASLAGWCLLSLLSCARVPARIGSQETEAGETVIPRAQLVARQIYPGSPVHLELENCEGSRPLPPPCRDLSKQHDLSVSSPARTLYDNITFEDDEELEMSTNRNSNTSSDASKEWNPLFASSPHVARDEEESEVTDVSHELSGPMATPCDPSFELLASCNTTPLITLMRSSGKDSDALLYIRNDSRLSSGTSTSTTFCIDLRKWQEKQQEKQQQQLGQEICEFLADRVADPLINRDFRFTSERARDSSRNKILSAFISRMVCCLSTPTRGSSIS